MAGPNPNIDIVDIDNIVTPFVIDGVAPAAPAVSEIDTLFEQEALIAFRLRRDCFGETFIYLASGGGERSVEGIVNREPVEGLDSLPHGNAPLMFIEVENNATDGISSSEINTGGDKCCIVYRPGESAQDRRITGITKMDRSSLILEVR